jgi:hypothetical protein
LSRVTEATQVWPDPLISDNRKVLVCFGLSCCLPVSVERSLLGAQGAGGGGDVLVAAPARGDTVLGVVGAAVEARAAVRLAEVEGVVLAVGEALAVGVGEGVSATTTVGGGGDAWTADPLLVPLMISAAINAMTTTAAAMTANRRSQ